MDPLEINLINAWHAVREQLRSKPHQLSKRFLRHQRGIMRNPPRSWCLTLRAADSRISPWIERPRHASAKGKAHILYLGGPTLRELTKPVHLSFPGVSGPEACERLGVCRQMIEEWAMRGWIEAHPLNKIPAGMKRTRNWRAAGRFATRGFFTRAPVDPGMGKARWEVWGSTWQSLYERIPDNFMQDIGRVPRMRGGRRVGWDWVCPGLRAPDGTQLICGRVCKKLYLPMPMWTVGDACGAGNPYDLIDAEIKPAPRRFACKFCWNPRYEERSSDLDAAWNAFVSHITAGLLYGREVAIPQSYQVAFEHEYARRIRRNMPKRSKPTMTKQGLKLVAAPRQ